MTQSLSTHTLAILPMKPALYSPVLPRNSRPEKSSPGGSPTQPRTSPGVQLARGKPRSVMEFSPGEWPFPTQPRLRELSLIRVTEVDGNTSTPPGGNCGLGKSLWVSSPSISTGAVDSPAFKSTIHVPPEAPKRPQITHSRKHRHTR